MRIPCTHCLLPLHRYLYTLAICWTEQWFLPASRDIVPEIPPIRPGMRVRLAASTNLTFHASSSRCVVSMMYLCSLAYARQSARRLICSSASRGAPGERCRSLRPTCKKLLRKAGAGPPHNFPQPLSLNQSLVGIVHKAPPLAEGDIVPADDLDRQLAFNAEVMARGKRDNIELVEVVGCHTNTTRSHFGYRIVREVDKVDVSHVVDFKVRGLQRWVPCSKGRRWLHGGW